MGRASLELAPGIVGLEVMLVNVWWPRSKIITPITMVFVGDISIVNGITMVYRWCIYDFRDHYDLTTHIFSAVATAVMDDQWDDHSTFLFDSQLWEFDDESNGRNKIDGRLRN